MNYKRVLDNTTLGSYQRIEGKCDGGNCTDSSVFVVQVESDIVALFI